MKARRMINSNKRICMPAVPEDMFIEAVEELVKCEKDWVPTKAETSLYIRPLCMQVKQALCSSSKNIQIYHYFIPCRCLLSRRS